MADYSFPHHQVAVQSDHHAFFLINVPSAYSLNATRSSSAVFITIGPRQATGSWIGFPEKKRNLNPFAEDRAVTDDPSPNRTRSRLYTWCPSRVSNVPSPAITYANAV